VRVRRWFLAGFGLLSIVYAVGLLFGSPLLPSAAVLAWAALFGYAVLAGRAAPGRVRNILLVGLLALGAVALLDLLGTGSGSGPLPGGPLPGGPLPGGPLPGGQFAVGVSGYTQFLSPAKASDVYRSYSPRIGETPLLLLGYGCLAFAVLARPARRSRRAAVLGAIVGGGCAFGYLVIELWSRSAGSRWGAGPGDLVRSLPAMEALGLAVGTFALAGAAVARRGGALPAFGSVLIALTTLDGLDRQLSWVAIAPARSPETFGTSTLGGNLGDPISSVSVAVAVAPGSALSVAGVVIALAQLAGAAAVTVGYLRAGVPMSGRGDVPGGPNPPDPRT
jgi:hypothetical protein